MSLMFQLILRLYIFLKDQDCNKNVHIQRLTARSIAARSFDVVDVRAAQQCTLNSANCLRNGRDLGARRCTYTLNTTQECVCYAMNMYKTGANLFFPALGVI